MLNKSYLHKHFSVADYRYDVLGAICSQVQLHKNYFLPTCIVPTKVTHNDDTGTH